MDAILMFALPAVFVLAAVGYTIRKRRGMLDVFEKLARRHRGRLVKGLLPRVVFRLEGADLQVSGLPGGKNNATKTFAWIELAEDPGFSIDLRRKPRRVGLLEKMGQEDPNTGHPAFDQAFWMHTDNDQAARAFLDRDVRKALLDFDARMVVRMRLGSTYVYRDGRWGGETGPSLEVAIKKLPPPIEEIERLIGLAKLAYERIGRSGLARAA